MKVVIIEDDNKMSELIALSLKIRWSDTEIFSVINGEKGLETIEIESPDLVILDLGLPDMTGFEVLKSIRLFSTVPVIIVTVMGDEASIVKGIEYGADDYITKPYRQLEFLARIKAITRRHSLKTEELSPIVFGPLCFSTSLSKFKLDDREIYLTRTESIVLYSLMQKDGKVLTHTEAANIIWGDDFPSANESLRVYIRRLREKIEENPRQPKIILTKIGVGYYLQKTT